MLTLLYLTFGTGIYVGAWTRSDKGFSSYSNIALIKGLLGVFVWPIMLIIMFNVKANVKHL